jgi:hypothetical protein
MLILGRLIIMSRNWKFINYLASAILCLLAIGTIFLTWSSYPFSIIQNNGYMAPTSAVGVYHVNISLHYPDISLIWLVGLVFIFTFALLLVKRKKTSVGSFWIKYISILIILFHITIWTLFSFLTALARLRT